MSNPNIKKAGGRAFWIAKDICAKSLVLNSFSISSIHMAMLYI